ncbi:MAG: 4-hydroxythreonine-4-phosphate dehydrogenase PdxA, partial [Blastocatellia bacterium]
MAAETCSNAVRIKPRVGVTIGDPAGIGPEIVVKVAARPEFATEHRAFVIGDRDRLDREIE